MHADRRRERIKLDGRHDSESILDSDERSWRKTSSFHGYHAFILLLFYSSANGVISYAFPP